MRATLRTHAGRECGLDHFTERARVVIGNPTRELQDFGIANWLDVDEILRVFNIYFSKFSRKFVKKADDVTGYEIASERHEEARADFCLNALFGSQAIGKRLKDMQRNCDFSVGGVSHGFHGWLSR